MRKRSAVLSGMLVLTVLVPFVEAGGPVLTHHVIPFDLENTGDGVSDGRLRFHIDTLAVPGEDYYLDNISLICIESERLVNGDFGAGLLPWRFFTNALPDPPTAGIDTGMVHIAFGSDGTNTQLFQRDLELPAAGSPCVLEFDACSTGGPDNPGFGHNFGIELIKHGPPYTKYGLDLHGNPPNPEFSVHSCNVPGECGNGAVESGEDCDDGNTDDGDGCSSTCEAEAICGDGVVDSPNAAGQFEDCDNGGGSVANQTTIQTETCDLDCTTPVCGDGIVNHEAGEDCEDIFFNLKALGQPDECEFDSFCEDDCTLDTLSALFICLAFLSVGELPDFCCDVFEMVKSGYPSHAKGLPPIFAECDGFDGTNGTKRAVTVGRSPG